MNYEKKINAHLRERSRLAFDLQIKSLDAKGKFAGYASVFDVVDSQKDIIIRGAFVETLKGRVSDIKLLWQHQQDEPIGVFSKMFEDARGLFVEGKLLLEVARAKEAYTLLQAGAISGLSIGYTPTKFRIHEKTGVRMLTKVDLWEVSLVTFPANSAAKVTVVKGCPHNKYFPHPNPLPDGEGTLPAIQLIALLDAVSRASAVLQK